MILDDFSLRGRVAIVTGAGTGLGEAAAMGLAEAGAAIVLVARKSPLERVAAAVAECGVECLALQADVAIPADRERIVNAALERFGHLDILVNNAGITLRKRAEDLSLEEWSGVMEVNLNAVFHLCQLAGRPMLAQRSGKIINIASLLSFQGGILVAPYAASKGAVAQLTKALANEWASSGVNVNAIAPGYFRTPMGEPLFRDPVRLPQILQRIPAGTLGEPAQLKGAVVFLASEASSYVHGHVLVVDGAWMAR